MNAQVKGLEVICNVEEDVPEFLRGDSGRLRQVLFNLIGNGIKFTAQGSVTLHVSALAETEDSAALRFTVSDTGMGIPAAKQEAIFSKFVQAYPSSTRRFGGTGLGLSICKQIVKLFHGEISVVSEEGKGSAFTFTAVFEKPPADASLPHGDGDVDPGHLRAARHVEAGSGTRRLRVLVAEDNTTNRIIAVKMLEKLGHVAEAVANGKEAVEALRQVPYDLVLMDCLMPVMDGFEATKIIRSPGSGVRNSLIPIIALTAYAMKEDRELCLDAGMNDYVSKPTNLHDLAAAIRRCDLHESHPGDAPPPPRVESPAALCDFDRKAFSERTMGDRNLAIEVVAIFLVDSRLVLEKISAAVEAGDAESAGNIAHTLKGSSATVGGRVLSKIAGQMQEAGENGNLPQLASLLASARAALHKLSSLLRCEFELTDNHPS